MNLHLDYYIIVRVTRSNRVEAFEGNKDEDKLINFEKALSIIHEKQLKLTQNNVKSFELNYLYIK